jgi:hypothetical protein
VAATHKGHHRKHRCPLQGNRLRAKRRQEQAIANEAEREAERLKAIEAATPPPPKFFQYLPCVCCGEPIGQVKGQKKRQFVDATHYEAWRRAALKEADGDAVDLVAERKHSEEVAAVAAKDAAIVRAADAVPMVTGEASFLLWARCLEFNAGDVAPFAA